MKISFRLLLGFYIVLSFAILLFSYTQVDLSLTLSRASFIQTIQKGFQQIGFYQRPLATGIYLGIIGALFLGYAISLHSIKQNLITKKQLWIVIGVISGILLFSYTAALSYDVFNYIFTAKTVLVYRLNPYVLIPRDLVGIEPMLSFMRWTHLPSAYTPLWIFLTLPMYLLSFGSLLFALWLMKALTIGFYLLSVFLIGELTAIKHKKLLLVAMALFALNPLVIIEVLVGAHNDIVMMGFVLLAWYLAQQKHGVLSFFALALSVATKLMTVVLLPLHFTSWNRKWALVAMSIALAAVLLRREFLPWYFLWVLPFAALFPDKRPIVYLTSGISLGLLLRYAPVLYYGHYNAPIPQLQFYGTVIPIAISVLLVGLLSIIKAWKHG